MAVKKKTKKTLSKPHLITNKKDTLINTSNDSRKKCCMGFCRNCANCNICRTNLDDQVRIIYGLITIIMIALGYYVSTHFFIATAVLAALYTLSGLSGICMVKNCLKCVPCNKNKV